MSSNLGLVVSTAVVDRLAMFATEMLWKRHGTLVSALCSWLREKSWEDHEFVIEMPFGGYESLGGTYAGAHGYEHRTATVCQ